MLKKTRGTNEKKCLSQGCVIIKVSIAPTNDRNTKPNTTYSILIFFIFLVIL